MVEVPQTKHSELTCFSRIVDRFITTITVVKLSRVTVEMDKTIATVHLDTQEPTDIVIMVPATVSVVFSEIATVFIDRCRFAIMVEDFREKVTYSTRITVVTDS